ncbi:MAG: V-type ATP synthase subunit E [Spirochaetales bacterium]|nr:V-type ATP synthase subunit E [Spirochaetales bacterium]
MDVQLKELLDTIKDEGIKTAEAESSRIIAEAEKKAQELLSAAKTEAEAIKAQAKVDADKMEASGKAALEQAGRDLVLSMKRAITALFDQLIKREVAGAMNDKVMEEGIVALLSAWKPAADDISVLIDKNSADKIAKTLESRLAAELKKGVEIRPFSAIDKGFRISEKDGSGYYDFSASGLGDMLARFLNPRLEEIVRDALKS